MRSNTLTATATTQEWLSPEQIERLLGRLVLLTVIGTLVCFAPASIDGGELMHDRLNAPKLVVANAGSLLLLLSLFVWSRRVPRLGVLAQAWIAALCLACAALPLLMFLSESRASALHALRPYLPYSGMIGVFWATTFSERARVDACRAAMLAAALLSLLVLAEEWGLPMPSAGLAGVTSPAATTAHRGSVAQVLIGAAPLVMALAFSARDRRRAWGWALLFGLLMGGMAATRSRASILSLVAGGSAVLILLPRLGRRWERAAMLAASSAIAIAVHLPSPMANRWVSMHEKIASTLRLTVAMSTAGDHGASDRLSLWHYALGKIAQHPLAGIGLGNFGVNDSDPLAGYWREAHNTWLHLGSELGVPGMLLCLAVLLVLVLAARQLIRARQADALHLGAIGAIVAYLACSFLETTIRSAQGANLIAAAMAGALIGWAEQTRVAREQRAAATIEP